MNRRRRELSLVLVVCFFRMKCSALILALGTPLILASCATMAPPQPPSLRLPKPPNDLRAVRKGDKVTLTWTIPTQTTDRQTARVLGPTRICRGLEPELAQCGTPVGEAERPPATTKTAADKNRAATYTDTLPLDLQQSNPSLFVTYAVEVLNQDKRGAGLSNQVRVPSAAALPAFPNFSAEVTAQGVRLSWALPPASIGMTPGFRYLFRIFRRQDGSTAEIKLADLDLQQCSGMTPAPVASLPGEQPPESCPTNYLDQTFEWEKTYVYRGAAVSVIAGAGKSSSEIEGDDTAEVKVFAHDVFPPAVPSGLQAVFSGPGQASFIDLIWAPVTDMDLDGYIVYRHEEGAPPMRINDGLVKTPAYRDTNVVSGKSYFYSVSAVDVRRNESARSEEASERVP
jgi:hypothetical protein